MLYMLFSITLYVTVYNSAVGSTHVNLLRISDDRELCVSPTLTHMYISPFSLRVCKHRSAYSPPPLKLALVPICSVANS